MSGKLLPLFAAITLGLFLAGTASAAQRCVLAELFASTT